jgi:adenine-specific DNA-methyltransferase
VAVRGDAVEVVASLPGVDLAYLDPPYNQHRYTANYHVWETIVAWDAPRHYGVACKRDELRDTALRSVFNERRRMPVALRDCIKRIDAGVVMVSYNDEAWVTLDELVDMCSDRGPVTVLAFDSRRYVGATIGIHGPSGEKVGRVSHLRNTEYLVVAGELSPAQRRQLRALAPAAAG